MFPPISADDETIRRHLLDAEIPPLLMTVAHLTDDLAVLPGELRPNEWLLRPQGGLDQEQQDAARQAAFELLTKLRDAAPPAPEPPDGERLRRLTSWAMGRGTADLVPLLAEELGFTGKAATWTAPRIAPGRRLRAAVIGAGMSGLLAAHRLSEAGVPCTVYERGSDVGGTWQANDYPGCRVDVPSHLYSYSFAPRTDWPEHFCTRDVLRDYFREFAKDTGLYERIQLGTEVTAAEWDEDAACWRLSLETADGAAEAEAEVLVSATGQLSRPAYPSIPGRESFAGASFHSAEWDHSIDLAGKRVAVVGTGASACQFIPELAGQVAELSVFQRTPPWLRPTPHYRQPVPEGMRWLLENLPYYSAFLRFWLLAPGLHGVLEQWVVDPEFPPTERAVSALNEQARSRLAAYLEAQLADRPDLLPKVMPDYPVGAKRVLRDDGRWLATLKRDDVRLVTEPIREITPTGIATADGRLHDVDVIVYGTGFRAAEFLMPMRVTGRGGRDLHAMWGGDARAYLGLTIPGFPNLFCLYGPNTNLSGQGGSIFYFSECGVTYLLDAVRHLLATSTASLEVRRDVHDDYNARLDTANANRAWGWSKVPSWFVNASGRSAQNWPFTAEEYWKRTHRVDPAEYVGTPLKTSGED
ncbi:flavin-containing monooxygenase [Actinomadura decatromicini]|uniref:NAD(P)/FAD-dependent oxidoreductase n=1 Tax=Actinomadura decatromicini TaxID=2604572 RepID=A0A5D3F806_9ACTN|nr:NAD(P)/FAD-dependent oxidoreductase [Actinomadura decatromicini]TYK44078.1 NAD(P)/FAD-dependent oxidoreductase [Actinomadura decatromicini]